MRHLIPRLALVALAGTTAGGAAPAAAQTVLDWPLVLEARPAVLVAGAGAVLGNPAATGELDARIEALVADLETPEALGLRALSLAAGAQLVGGWSMGVAYRHVGVGDMVRTDGPPISPGPAPLPTLDVAEDVYALAVAYRTGPFGMGVAGRLDSPASDLGGEAAWAGTVGIAWAPAVPYVGLRIGTTMEVDQNDPGFALAAEVGSPALIDQQLRLALAYGSRLEHELGAEHALVATGTWRNLAELQLGATAQPGSDHADWVPIIAGLVRLGRYRLGIVREHLPNDFGAAMHYRLSVVF